MASNPSSEVENISVTSGEPRLARVAHSPVLAWLAWSLVGLVIGLYAARTGFDLAPASLQTLGSPAGAAGMATAGIALALAAKKIIRSGGLPSFLLPFLILAIYVVWPGVDLIAAGVLLIGALVMAAALGLEAWLSPAGRAASLLPGLGLAAALLAAFLKTMGQTVGEADTFEFQVIAPGLGIPHPTGYPLLILIDKLFSLLPFGEVAWRVNLVSVLSATAACILVYALLARLTGRRAAPALAALALGFSRAFWSQAVEIEVYALNAAFVAALLLIVLAPSGNFSRRLLGLAALYGLSLTNHLTMTLLGPALLVGVLLARPRITRWNLGWAALCLIAPLSLDLFILFRWPALHNGNWMSMGEFFGYLTGSQFRGALQPGLWRDPTRWSIVSGLMLEAFTPVGAALAGAGWLWMAARRRQAAAVTALAFAAYWAYGLVYNVPDIADFVLPAHLIMAIWIGAAIAALGSLFAGAGMGSAERSPRSMRSAPALVWVACALLPLCLAWTNGPLVDRSEAGRSLEQWGRYVLSLPLPTRSAILADSEKIAPLYYLKTVQGVRPDIDTVVLGTEELYRADLDRRVAAGQTVYLARYLPGLAGVYHLHSVGPLVRASKKPVTAPPPMQKALSGVSWGDGKIALLGLDAQPGQGDVAWRLTLYWQARAKLDENYHVRLRWLGQQGQVWWQDHGANPVNGNYPTVAWEPGEIIADYHEIPADPAIPPGMLQLEVGWFLPFQNEGLNRDGTASSWQILVFLEQMEPDASDLALRGARASFGGEMVIESMSDPGVLPPGEPVNLTFQWSRVRPGPDRQLRLRWVSASGQAGQAYEIEPYGGENGTSAWTQDVRLMGRITIPAPSAPGVYTLRAGWLAGKGDTRLLPAHCGWLAAPAGDCPLGTLRVEGEPGGVQSGINFDNLALLISSQVENTQIRPGENLGVKLQWQGLRQWNANYTVFVHLLGPDGKLHGQVDQWPVQGTLATLDWQPGRMIDDPYRVTLAADAPPGTYQVEVGWYLLATQRRLPVVDPAGRPIDDRVIIGAFTVTQDQ